MCRGTQQVGAAGGVGSPYNQLYTELLDVMVGKTLSTFFQNAVGFSVGFVLSILSV